jgi:hypothetical protein
MLAQGVSPTNANVRKVLEAEKINGLVVPSAIKKSFTRENDN